MTLHYVFSSSQWQQWASVGTSVKNTVVFSRNTLLTLTQFDTFTPGSRRVQPQSDLLVSELLRCRYREPIITYVRRDDGTRFWTVFPGRRSWCCTRLFTREVAEVVVWRMKKESWRESDPNTSTFLSSTHLAVAAWSGWEGSSVTFSKLEKLSDVRKVWGEEGSDAGLRSDKHFSWTSRLIQTHKVTLG